MAAQSPFADQEAVVKLHFGYRGLRRDERRGVVVVSAGNGVFQLFEILEAVIDVDVGPPKSILSLGRESNGLM